MPEKKDDKIREIILKVEKEQEQGVYSNAASVHINKNEVIIDFAYQIPAQEKTTLKLVSRINLSYKTAKSFMSVLSNAMLDWDNKNKEK